jgi:preflagellin peptidase FlaK
VQILAAARVSVVIAFFVYASWSDHKSREVSDKVWILLGPLSLALMLAELLLFYPSNLIPYAISFGVTTAFAIILFYAGGFGGADAKALMCLALALPFYPENLLTPLAGSPSPISTMIFPIAVFSNSVLFAALSAVVLLFYNLVWHLRKHENLFQGSQKTESPWKKVLVLITGYKASVNRLKEKWHIYPMEDIESAADNGYKRKLIVLPKDEGRNEIVERLDKAVQSGAIKDGLWATPGLPMLIFVTAGLLVALFLGDIVWIGIRLVLG